MHNLHPETTNQINDSCINWYLALLRLVMGLKELQCMYSLFWPPCNLTIFLLLPVPFTRRVEAKTQTNKCTSKISLSSLMNLGWSIMSCITLRETASVSICTLWTFISLYFPVKSRLDWDFHNFGLPYSSRKWRFSFNILIKLSHFLPH